MGKLKTAEQILIGMLSPNKCVKLKHILVEAENNKITRDVLTEAKQKLGNIRSLRVSLDDGERVVWYWVMFEVD